MTAPSQRRAFPGWSWVTVALAFPVAGYIAWTVSGPVDAMVAALVGYDTDLGSLALMGLVSGASLGAAQGSVLAQQRKRQLGAAWGAAMPMLFALSWVATTAIGVSVENQFTVFGAGSCPPPRRCRRPTASARSASEKTDNFRPW